MGLFFCEMRKSGRFGGSGIRFFGFSLGWGVDMLPSWQEVFLSLEGKKKEERRYWEG